MAVRTIWEAMARRRFLLTSWPWRGLSYVLSTPLVSLLVGMAVAAMCLPWFYLASRFLRAQPTAPAETVLVGLMGLVVLVAGGPLVAVPVARLERLRLRLVDADPVSPPVVATVGSRLGRLRRRYTEPATWRELAYLVVVTLAALPSAAIVLTLAMAVALIAGPLLVEPESPLALGFGQVRTVAEAAPFALVGAVSIPVTLYLVAGLAGLHATAARALLSGADERLRSELVEVSRSRERLVTAFEVERRRIERDLHDGAQQRLVGLILQLGLAKVEMPPDAPGTGSVANAHDQAKLLLTELREFIHGIHPQALSDLGLPSALQELADRSAIAVTVECTIPQRPSAAVEGAGYFVVAEALSNAGKHSGATEIRVAATVRQGVLTVEVTDNGRGGADARHGSGLTGLADRAAALGGTLSLSSPVGGPTTVRAEFPCG
ncbi:sensor histidine kinase [Pseudonocardia sp. TRM90224]|uniref:sensor histidine kinase n=1 Tax=Pseudonocardia sp. TRM90224 TaxID=2812678 RepID=UPI001E37EE9C|nr:sensor domain-containing protein [Pseudonocardia sp. TRM90224]